MAHRLVMFAHIEPGTAGPELVIEAKFSSGRLPTQGEVIIKDAEEAVVMQLPLSDTGVTTLPLADLPTASWQEGLAIEVSTSEGHDDYWLLSGDDIRAAFPSPNQSPNLPDTKSEGD